MRTSLDHLPESTRDLLVQVVATIREETDAAWMVIVFGSYARGEQVNDPEGGYYSDLDLLVLVDGPQVAADDALWNRVGAAVRKHTGSAPVDIIVHDFREVNRELRRAQFFFVDIWQHGVVLFDTRRFALARPKAATAEERRTIAQEYFDHWFESANGFFDQHTYAVAKGRNNIAAFELHQATERYFSTAQLVFTGTKPKTHNLTDLVQMVSPLHPLLAAPFPMDTEEDRRLFQLLKRAYIEARYSRSYKITKEELAVLGERVKDLAGRVERSCREKIESFT